MAVRALLLGLLFLGGAACLALAADADPVLTDAPPPVPLGIVEGSAREVAPVAPRRGARPRGARPRTPSVRRTGPAAEKPMDRYARIPRPSSRAGRGSAFALSNHGAGGGHTGADCTH